MYQFSIHYDFSNLYAPIINKIDFGAIRGVFIVLKDFVVNFLSNFLLVLLILSGIIFWLSSKTYLKESPFELKFTSSNWLIFLCFIIVSSSGMRLLLVHENINSSTYGLLVYIFSLFIYPLCSLSPVLIEHKRIGDTINFLRFNVWRNIYFRLGAIAYFSFAILGIFDKIGVLFIIFLPILLFLLTTIIVELEIGENQKFKYNTLKNRGIIFKAEDINSHFDILSVEQKLDDSDIYRPFFFSIKELKNGVDGKIIILEHMFKKLKTIMPSQDNTSEYEVLALYFTNKHIHFFNLKKEYIGKIAY